MRWEVTQGTDARFAFVTWGETVDYWCTCGGDYCTGECEPKPKHHQSLEVYPGVTYGLMAAMAFEEGYTE